MVQNRAPGRRTQPQQQPSPVTSSSIQLGPRVASSAWLEALQQATAVLHDPSYDVEVSLQYLNQLEFILKQQEANWHRAPKKKPPRFPVPSPHQSAVPKEHKSSPIVSNNPYASIFDQGDDDEESEVDSYNVEDAEAGDVVIEQVTYPMRRLLTRVWAAQSDVLAHAASICLNDRQWQPAVYYCTSAVTQIRSALVFADEEISGFVQNHLMTSDIITALADDADIVSVSVQHLVAEKDRLEKTAQREVARLQRRLEPQWQARDQVREKMGDRWYSNPQPKCNHSGARQQDENLLREVRKALHTLQELNVAELETSSSAIRARLARPSGGTPSRYNGQRPHDLTRRVSLVDYPDPAGFGWTFTGSNEVSRVEFFEKDGIKLDWYYTTGTLKTSLKHPTQGKTQLFVAGKQISPEMYRKILENPRTHTGARYRKRNPRSHRGRHNGH